MAAIDQQTREVRAEVAPHQDARRVRRVVNCVAIVAEAFAAWNILAFVLSRQVAAYTRPDLVGVAASAQRREVFSGALFILFFCFATYSLSRSPRRAKMPSVRRYLRSVLWAAIGVALLFGIELGVLALMLRGFRMQ